MSKRDEEILASIGMTEADVDAIAEACESGDYSMWDGSRVFYGSPLKEEMTTISIRLPKSRVAAIERVASKDGLSRSEFVRRAIDQELMETA